QSQVTFAGAKGIAFYVQDNEIIQLGSERYSIGGSLKKERKFTNQTIILPENTMIYLASDGYIDQNDPERVKFGIKNFKEILSKIHQYPVQLQYDTLLDTLKKHIGEEEQRDDISVVGIRL
nr:SpoIIE family protein phosphatase [Thermoflexibacter sp.]